MRRFHIAIGVADVSSSIGDYTARLASPPTVVVPGEYALWRTDTLNLSIRRVEGAPGMLRHLGWEDSSAPRFSSDTDVNGIVWEHFAAEQQDAEIEEAWPSSRSSRSGG